MEIDWIAIAVRVGVLAVVWCFLWVLFIGPHWHVWKSHKEGQADLQKAKNEQQIQVAKAQGRLDAAKLNKDAAVVEAEAVSEQIDRIGAQLTQHDLYLKWQWIKMMEESGGDHAVIYVPTEAGLPILEAGRTPKRGETL